MDLYKKGLTVGAVVAGIALLRGCPEESSVVSIPKPVDAAPSPSVEPEVDRIRALFMVQDGEEQVESFEDPQDATDYILGFRE